MFPVPADLARQDCFGLFVCRDCLPASQGDSLRGREGHNTMLHTLEHSTPSRRRGGARPTRPSLAAERRAWLVMEGTVLPNQCGHVVGTDGRVDCK
jgi:hypothetical protein